MSLQRYFLNLSYKGTHYQGWQIQPNQRTVQGEIEKVLTQLNRNRPVELTGCGRTDTGVHARNYYAHFDSSESFEPGQLRFKMNTMLPPDIAIKQVWLVKEDLHARFSAISRTYEYRINTNKDPFLAETSWHYNLPLDTLKIREACDIIARHTDFECFSKVNTDVSNFHCTIHHIDWQTTNDGHIFIISANRFLRNMVRAVTGTLLDVGTGKILPADLYAILESRNRGMAGTSVPAHGLNLVRIDYPDGAF